MESWAERRTKLIKNSPSAWVEELRPEIMQRIKYYEDYLEKWGIVAQAGVEIEFHAAPHTDEFGSVFLHHVDDVVASTKTIFPNSPYVEDVYHEVASPNKYEIVVGRGKKNVAVKGKENWVDKEYPDNSLTPAVMVRTVEATQVLIDDKKDDYHVAKISLDPTEHGERLYSGQVNMSLWDKKTGKNLFPNYITNEIAESCITSLLESQNSLIAFLTTNINAFKRFDDQGNINLKNKTTFYKNSKSICYGETKDENPSILFRTPADNGNSRTKYSYLENRLPNADTPPCVSMLMTLAGMANGVKKYLKDHGIVTPEEFHESLIEGDYVVHCDSKNRPKYAIPKTQGKALEITEQSDLAKEILGEELHEKFCKEYKHHISNQSIKR